ncbi:hypothetical protein N0V82_001290 [Gnomoniopsis sp. IMI 355080]|nr:hypothetical protein N0V82_001290 [Gnomoniopsis sp. IMI 355080]
MLDNLGPILWTALALLAVYAVQTLRRWRYKFAEIPQLGQPSLIMGHLLMLAKLFKKVDPRTHIVLFICNADVAEQITKASSSWSYSIPKAPTLQYYWPLTGRDSIVTAEGEHWKSQRRRLNPGFAPQHLLTTLPIILDKTKLFLARLDRHAESNAEFSFDQLLTALTFDIIGAVTMGQNFNAQIPGEESEILNAFMEILASYQGRKRPEILNWIQDRKRQGLTDRIEKLTKDVVRQEFARSASTGHDIAQSRSVLGLSLQGGEELTPELLQQTSDNLRVFLFAGHDTTSILMQWVLYELSRSPKQRRALFEELDKLFGTDVNPATVGAKLLAPGGAELLGQMTYGTAVIKETLRLHPPAASVRMTAPGTDFQLTLPDGKTICPDGCILYLNSFIIHHDVNVWGETVDDFVPERWLGDTSWMPPGSWRPFERGPRSCIGLELANIEAKVILAQVARKYEFVKVGLGELELDADGQPMPDEKGYYRTKSELFNTTTPTAKPVDGTMMKVRLSERAMMA